MNSPRRPTWHAAYDAQMGLWRFLGTSVGQAFLRTDWTDNTRGLAPDLSQFLQGLYRDEQGKLFSAEPFFVSAEMCEVVDAARDSFEPEPLLPTDLLTGCGFIYFERPFVVPDRFEDPVQIAAVSWMPIINVHGQGEEAAEFAAGVARGDALRLLSDRLEHEQEANPGEAFRDGIAITLYGSREPLREQLRSQGRELLPGLPELLPFHFTPWWFAMSFEGNEIDANGVQTGAAWWWKVVQTTFRLMQQQISTRHPERPDRAARRDAARRGFPEREVVVVRLRREAGEPHDSPIGEANYSHRFIVSGHWRNQWYPASSVHRQIWISPYCKGPEDRPLVIRPRRVYTWNR